MTDSTWTKATICKGCWQQMHVPIPLRGVLSVPFRAFGVRPSRMNPNVCTICELMFTKVMKARNVKTDATILFADLSGYTRLSQSLSSADMNDLLDAFYDECAGAIWRFDGLLNKTIGDAVMAVFNFPIRNTDHTTQALLAAREIQNRFEAVRTAFVDRTGSSSTEREIGVTVGIHCGEITFGEFGHAHRDITAIGTVVNTAARAQSVATAGQILVTEAVYERARLDLSGCTAQDHQLKGFDAPVRLYAIPSPPS
jgi:class 3 adenylate cyclase